MTWFKNDAGSMECKTTAQVEQSRGGPTHRAEMIVDFGNLDLSGTGTDASKVFATYIEFKEKYPDLPTVDTMDERLRAKYGELSFDSYRNKWSKSGAPAPDLDERKTAYKAQEKECDSIPRAERISKLECSLVEAELHYAYLAGRPADLTARYFLDNRSAYSDIRIIANWTHWDAVKSLKRTSETAEEMLAEAKAEPQIDEDVETTF